MGYRRGYWGLLPSGNCWLRPALFATALTQIVRAGLLQAVAARRLAAVAAIFPQLGLKGLNPCLEIEDEGSQRTHQGQYGFFALHVGGMDICWGRQALGCHGIYYALLLSALHEGMLTLLVCLSSYSKTYTRFVPFYEKFRLSGVSAPTSAHPSDHWCISDHCTAE